MIEEFQELANSLRFRRSLLRLFVRSSLFSISVSLTNVLVRFGFNSGIANAASNNRVYNVGCGDHVIDGVYNFDILPRFDRLVFRGGYRRFYERSVYPINVLLLDRNLKESADVIIFHHVLEHLPPHTAGHALEVLFHMLAKGGVLRISVPSYIFYTDGINGRSQGFTQEVVSVNSLFYGWGHMFIYTPELLEEILRLVGFRDVRRSSFGVGVCSEYDDVSRSSESLYFECRK